jgi:mono/diheme cytochrome c family protein
MSSCFNRHRRSARRARPYTALSGCGASAVAWFACALAASFSLALSAQQPRTVKDGVYTDAQAKRGLAVYTERCSQCHGQTLGGDIAPPLVGDDFIGDWNKQTLADLVDKIKNTMPADDPGKLTQQQSADVVAYILQVGKFPAGRAELASAADVLKLITLPPPATPSRPPSAVAGAQAPSFPPFGNLAQVMRGILFPASNIIFDVQTKDPAKKVVGASTSDSSLTDRFADVYQGWALVDYAAVTLVESAPMMLTPGRRCENGKPVPVDRPDWIKFTQGLVEAGQAAYKASQSRNQDAVIEATNQVADSCLNCHRAYRDRRNIARCVVQ